jgi:hypothetical protein
VVVDAARLSMGGLSVDKMSKGTVWGAHNHCVNEG